VLRAKTGTLVTEKATAIRTSKRNKLKTFLIFLFTFSPPFSSFHSPTFAFGSEGEPLLAAKSRL
jgi:hypothetical protein